MYILTWEFNLTGMNQLINLCNDRFEHITALCDLVNGDRSLDKMAH